MCVNSCPPRINNSVDLKHMVAEAQFALTFGLTLFTFLRGRTFRMLVSSPRRIAIKVPRMRTIVPQYFRELLASRPLEHPKARIKHLPVCPSLRVQLL